MANETHTDYDSPWKEILETYFEAFMGFFFPKAAADIDWSRGYEFLDKELQQIVRDAELGRRRVDKLVKVWRKNGAETWVLIHIEVQGRKETAFAERMYVYNYRLFDRYRRLVISLAVLADEDADWRPDHFGYELWDCQAGLWFPTVKLLDYREQWAALEQSDNPFAVVVMAHLQTQATRRDPSARLEWKWRLVRGLYERGYERQDILNLFHFIDWLMDLPDELELEFEEKVKAYEEAEQMPYISSIEQRGLEQGLRQKAQEDIIEILKVRFRDVPPALIERINDISQSTILNDLLKQAVVSDSVADFEQYIVANVPNGSDA